MVAERRPETKVNAIYLRTGHPSDEKEIEAANQIIAEIGGRLEIIDISNTVAALGAKRVLIHSQAAIMPFGNAIVLSIAAAYALAIKADSILIGIHADDAAECSEYTRGFSDAIEKLVAYAHREFPRVETPLISMTKVDVIKAGAKLGVDYSRTWSCIRDAEKHCGQCGACRARRNAFSLAGVEDLTEYVTEPLALQTAAH